MHDDERPVDDAEAVAQSLAAAFGGEDVLATVRELLLARLAEDQLTPEERREAERLLADLSGGPSPVQ